MRPLIIAHRGASHLAPENTLTAFRLAKTLGADGFECDVQITRDRHLVVAHDYLTDLKTGVHGNIPDDGVKVTENGKIVPEMKDIFQLVKDYDAVLGTAHISPEESFIVCDAARAAGVKKLVVTHPEWWVVDMSIEDQKRIVKDYDVLLERCYAQNMGGGKYKSNLPENLEVIREVGYKNVLISTDGGQTENPHWEIAMQQYLQYLSDHGVPDEQIYYMSHTIAAGLLGIE